MTVLVVVLVAGVLLTVLGALVRERSGVTLMGCDRLHAAGKTKRRKTGCSWLGCRGSANLSAMRDKRRDAGSRLDLGLLP